MAREKRLFLCTECGAEHPLWVGQCNACQRWNTLTEFKESAPGGRPHRSGEGNRRAQPVLLSSVGASCHPRLHIGIRELDQVLGGGLTHGSAILVAGDPGIGKSTLLLETLARLSRQAPVLYVTGEESVEQIRLRSDRLGLSHEQVWILAENNLESVEQGVESLSPLVLAVDSIQTLASQNHPAAAGSVTQVRESAARLISLAKQRGMVLFLVGHVTKEGQIAGPRILEHMVDTVLYFEGERTHNYRILRAVKNRFGPANEIGVFEMSEAGLREAPNPSELFLAERVAGATGAVVFPAVEGTRPVLVEIQSLVAPSTLAQPRRNTLGVDGARLAMLIAVMEKRLGLGLFDRDIFLNVAGGLRINEPTVDLAVAVALFASHRNLPVDPGLVVLGEVGLSGEVRLAPHAPLRLREAAKLGFTRCILPEKCLKNLPEGLPMAVNPVHSLGEAMERIVS